MQRMTLVFFATTLLSGASMATADTTGDKSVRKTTDLVTSRTENSVFEYSARKVLGFVSEARMSVSNKNKETALAYLDESLRELNAIRNTRDYLEMIGIRFGRVLYGESDSYYIPVADDTYAVRTYARGPFWSGDKATAVRDVELVSVDIAINPERAIAHLQSAKQKIDLSDWVGADSELKNMLDESIHETTATHQPFTRMQDNIYLTRILIRQHNYDGARFTLKHAKAALGEYEKTVTTPERRTNVENLRKEIDSLDDVIQRRDPTLLKKATDKVDQWWNDLKTWTREKTS